MPDPTHFSSIGWLLLCLAALAGALNQGLGLMDRFRDKPAAGEVQRETAAGYVSKQECARTMADLNARLTQLDQWRVTDAKDGANSRRSIYDELKTVERKSAESVTALQREMGEMERRLNRADEERTLAVHARLNEILAEVSELRGEMHHPRNPA